MANQAELDDAPTLDELIADQDQANSPEIPDDDGPSEDQEEVVISFGDDEDDEDDTAELSPEKRERYAELRRQNRDQARRIKELETQQAAPVQDIGPKPTLESCEYDGERFEAALDAWKDQKAKADAVQSQAQKDQEAIQAEWKAEVERYNLQGKELKVGDYTDALDTVSAALNQVQQAVLVKATKNGALVTYALFKSPQRLAGLAAIKDPIKLAVAINDLERGLKMTTRRRAADPDTPLRGSAPIARGVNPAEKAYEKMLDTSTPDERRAYRAKHNLDVDGKTQRK